MEWHSGKANSRLRTALRAADNKFSEFLTTHTMSAAFTLTARGHLLVRK
jgi:hypothetical protein